MAFDPCDPCTCIPGNIDDRLFHQMALVVLCGISSAVGGDLGAFTNGAATVTRVTSAGVGSAAAGAYRVKIRNTGAANGTVLGAVIEPDEEITLDAVVDPVTHIFELLPVIAFDGTGTSLVITRTAA